MKFAILALLLWFTAYSFGETDGSERRERVSKAEMKLVQSRAVQAATECDHLGTERAAK